MTVLIDSWAWVEYFRGSAAGERAKAHIDGEDEAVLSVVNVSEVYRWFLKHYGPEKAEEARAILRGRCLVLDLTEPLAVEAARLRHAKGWGLGDAIVWATAQSASATLVTGDPDFRGLEGVLFLG